jgi:hypothetical protein
MLVKSGDLFIGLKGYYRNRGVCPIWADPLHFIKKIYVPKSSPG